MGYQDVGGGGGGGGSVSGRMPRRTPLSQSMILFSIGLSFITALACLLRGHRRAALFLFVHGALSLLNHVAESFWIGLLVVHVLPALLLHLGARSLGRDTLARAAWLAIPALLILGRSSGAFHDAEAYLRLVEASWLALLGLGLGSFILAPRPLVRDEQLLLLFTLGGLGEIAFLMLQLPYSYVTRENLLLYLLVLLACVVGRGDRARSGSPTARSGGRA